MKKISRRILAYIIDLFVVTLIVQCLSGIPQINPQLDAYNKYFDEYLTLSEKYNNFKSDLDNYYEDDELSDEEYQTLITDNEAFEDILNKYYKNGKLTEKNYEKLNKEITESYDDEYKEVYYKIEQNSCLYLVIYLVVIFVYFVLFNKYTGGQTLGKKLMRLKIVNSEDENADVPVWSYVVRTLILYQSINYVVRLIGINILDLDMYYNVALVFSNIQYYLEIFIIIVVMMRTDGRGPHDLLAKTRVVLYDKDGREVEDNLDIMVTKKIDAIKSGKKKTKKIIDEESSE